MTGALHISEKSPKITTEYLWHREGVYGVGAQLDIGKLGFGMMSKNWHIGMVMEM